MKIIYSYDGSGFAGSQKQPGKRTVQGEIEYVLRKVDEEPIALVPSGRTDSHVHALNQVAHFDLCLENIQAENFMYMFKRQLPNDIQVSSVEEVTDAFHARFDAVSKTYRYRFFDKTQQKKSPFTSRYIVNVDVDIDIEKMNAILSEYLGEHDFTAFTVTPRHKKNVEYIREIYQCYCELNEEIGCYEVVIEGNGFLQYMVRILVGFAFDIHEGKDTIQTIKKLFENKDKKYLHVKAEPHGLYLSCVNYENK